MAHRRSASCRLPRSKNKEHLPVVKKLSLRGKTPQSPENLDATSRTFSQEELDKIGSLGLAYADTTTVTITPAQRSLLRYSWQHVGKQGSSNIGIMIFKRIFQKNPQIRKIFPFGDQDLCDLPYNQDFKKHASVFIGVIDGAIKHLDSLGEYALHLMRYGMRHADLEPRGFKPQFWDVFAEAMMESAIDWTGPGGRHRETIRAWTALMCYITDKMRYGYDMEIKARKKVVGSAGSLPPISSRPSSTASDSPIVGSSDSGAFCFD